MITREQNRSRDAARAVQDIDASLDERVHKKVNPLAKKLPVMIRTNGLLQTTAFLMAKAPDSQAHRRVLRFLEEQLHVAGYVGSTKTLHEAAASADYSRYLRMQEEAVACAAWLKRFATARWSRLGENED